MWWLVLQSIYLMQVNSRMHIGCIPFHSPIGVQVIR